MRVLVTGAAGFIGAAVAERLLARGDHVLGIDNLNDYYDVGLKQARLALLQRTSGYQHLQLDIADREALDGYRFVGSAHVHESGPAFDDAVAFAQERGLKYPRCAVVIAIDDIYTLKPGVTAGKRV